MAEAQSLIPLQRWHIVIATCAIVLAIVYAVTQSVFGKVISTWPYAGFTLVLLLTAGTLGLFLTERLAVGGLFNGSTWPRLFRLVMSIALGLGLLSIATLLLGFAHLLALGGGWVAVILQIAALLMGLGPTKRFLQELRVDALTARTGQGAWMLLAAGVPIGVMLVAATFPPGTLWTSEGRGYDVVEYHLEMPREYSETNSVMPVEHNVYSYLPANVEMLYLLEIQTAKAAFSSDSALWAVYPSQFLHVAFMLLAALAIGVAPLPLNSFGRLTAIVVALAIPWTIVTGSLAYDEGGMMLWGTLALGLGFDRKTTRMHAIIIGVLLGLAVGSKLTAGLFFAVPAALILLLRKDVASGIKHVLISGLIAIAVFLPWGLRTAIASGGNPVFPLAARTLSRDHWSAEQVEKFEKGHTALTEQAGISAHLDALAHEWFLHDQWSPSIATAQSWKRVGTGRQVIDDLGAWSHVGPLWIALAIAILLAFLLADTRLLLLSTLLILAVQLLAWLALTHLQSRFLMPTMVPLAWIIGLALSGKSTLSMLPLKGIVVLAVLVHTLPAVFLLWPEAGLLAFTRGPAQTPPIGNLFENQINLAATIAQSEDPIYAHEHVLLVGLATPLFWQGHITYSTVFDKEQLAEQLRIGGPGGAAQWLRDQKFDYVVISWPEIQRLRSTYGFDPALTQDAVSGLIAQGLQVVPLPDAPGMTILKVQ